MTPPEKASPPFGETFYSAARIRTCAIDHEVPLLAAASAATLVQRQQHHRVYTLAPFYSAWPRKTRVNGQRLMTPPPPTHRESSIFLFRARTRATLSRGSFLPNFINYQFFPPRADVG